MCEPSTDEKTSIALIGATLINGTGKPAIRDSTITIEGNGIKKVGTRNEIEVPEKATIIDLTGKTVTPGFIDSHLHYFIVSISVKTINLSDTKSLQETLDIVKERATKLEPGEWVHGILWDERARRIVRVTSSVTFPQKSCTKHHGSWQGSPSARFLVS
jgi:predicted amidohydrolase YtcJ